MGVAVPMNPDVPAWTLGSMGTVSPKDPSVARNKDASIALNISCKSHHSCYPIHFAERKGMPHELGGKRTGTLHVPSSMRSKDCISELGITLTESKLSLLK